MTDYIDNINNIPLGGKILDGQWTFKSVWLLSNYTLAGSATNTLDLSEYLPQDGADYEILGWIYLNAPATNGYQSIVAIMNGNNNYTQRISSSYVRESILRSGGGSFRLITESGNRSLKLVNVQNFNAQSIYVKLEYYRRIGANQ